MVFGSYTFPKEIKNFRKTSTTLVKRFTLKVLYGLFPWENRGVGMAETSGIRCWRNIILLVYFDYVLFSNFGFFSTTTVTMTLSRSW